MQTEPFNGLAGVTFAAAKALADKIAYWEAQGSGARVIVRFAVSGLVQCLPSGVAALGWSWVGDIWRCARHHCSQPPDTPTPALHAYYYSRAHTARDERWVVRLEPAAFSVPLHVPPFR